MILRDSEYKIMLFNNMKLYVNAAVIIDGVVILFFSDSDMRQDRFLWESR